jgi:hypothetical protein
MTTISLIIHQSSTAALLLPDNNAAPYFNKHQPTNQSAKQYNSMLWVEIEYLAIRSSSSMVILSILFITYRHGIYTLQTFTKEHVSIHPSVTIKMRSKRGGVRVYRLPSIISINSSAVASHRSVTSALLILYSFKIFVTNFLSKCVISPYTAPSYDEHNERYIDRE